MFARSKWSLEKRPTIYRRASEADHSLLMTVGLLITSISITLLLAAYRKTRVFEIGVLAVASAAGLTAIDVIYVARHVILPVYLLDAVIEVPLILAWCIALAARPTLDRSSAA